MFRATTIICVRKEEKIAIAGDGQVSLGETVLKQKANKIRNLYKGKVLAGFAGAKNLGDGYSKSCTPVEIEQYRSGPSRCGCGFGALEKKWQKLSRSLYLDKRQMCI